MIPPIAPDESSRLAALRSYDAGGIGTDEALNEVARIAASVCQTPQKPENSARAGAS